jgi:integrase
MTEHAKLKPASESLLNNKESSAPMQKVKKVSKPNSRKHSIKKLPNGWIDEFFLFKQRKNFEQPQSNQGDVLFAIALSIAVGLRPIELENVVKIHKIGDQIEIEITGAKYSKNEYGVSERGIEKRWITINPEYALASKYVYDIAHEILKDSRNNYFEFGYRRDTLRKIVATTTKSFFKECYPKMKPESISPYSFRHMMSAALKSDESLSDVQIAQVLGHLSTESMKSYAKKFRRGTPKKPMLRVRSSELPRQQDKHTFKPSKPSRRSVPVTNQSLQGPSF